MPGDFKVCLISSPIMFVFIEIFIIYCIENIKNIKNIQKFVWFFFSYHGSDVCISASDGWHGIKHLICRQPDCRNWIFFLLIRFIYFVFVQYLFSSFCKIKLCFITTRSEVAQGNIFTSRCQEFCPQREVSVPACTTVHMTRGVSVQAGLCPKGVSVQGGLCHGRSLSRGYLIGRTPHMVMSGRYTSYWNAFLLILFSWHSHNRVTKIISTVLHGYLVIKHWTLLINFD